MFSLKPNFQPAGSATEDSKCNPVAAHSSLPVPIEEEEEKEEEEEEEEEDVIKIYRACAACQALF